MLDPNSDLRNGAVVFLIFRGQFFAARFLLGLNDSDPSDGETLKTSVLEQSASIGEVITRFIGGLFVVFLAFTGSG